MIEIKDRKQCCGCTACESICKKKCISMVSDAEGFVYPEIDKDECIKCHACEKVCPVIKSKDMLHTEEVLATYVGYVVNEQIRADSSSGGVFSLIADYILEHKGVVVGAAYDEHFAVQHIVIENKNDLFRLRGSKYSQSELTGIYPEVQNYLKSGRLVLFSGTACQVSGLKNYLKIEYSKLITVDILCHGVPSPAVWARYIKELEASKGILSSVNLRSKNTGWYAYSSKYDFQSGESIENIHFVDPYMKLFLGDICLRPSCHDCQFKSMDRNSDITLGDSWGIDRLLPEFADDKGTSVIVIHSENGQSVFEEICGKMVYEVADLDVVLSKKENSRKSVEAHINRKKFFADFAKEASINQLGHHLKKSVLDKIRRKIRNKFKGNIGS